MSRLIVVSNRAPVPDRPPSGGLAAAMHRALARQGGIWLGWSGKSCGDRDPEPLSFREEGAITFALTDLSDRDLSEYYQGFANSVLWPLCHYRIDLTDYARRDVDGYYRVNRLMAERLAGLLRPDDLIWVHDYHLIPLAAELRQMGVTNRIGFFMHIPWPAADVFFTLPVQDKLLRAMTAYDLIGVQTEADADNLGICFKRSGIARRVPGAAEAGPRLYANAERSFTIEAFPIGIDVESFSRTAKNAVRNPAMRRFRESLGGQQLVVGVDRLDYTKGLPQRLAAYRRFLELNQAWMGRITYLQVTPRSRAGVAQYDALQREVAEMAGHIAGSMGHLDWTPVRYINRAFGQHVLAGVYRMARAALVTPLRDGMNLVAKEYVAAQDADDPGVLVLSRFAGAAEELADGALLVNPYDEDSIANALAAAVSMGREQRCERHGKMLDTLSAHTVYDWCERYLERLSGAAELPVAGFTEMPATAVNRH